MISCLPMTGEDEQSERFNCHNLLHNYVERTAPDSKRPDKLLIWVGFSTSAVICHFYQVVFDISTIYSKSCFELVLGIIVISNRCPDSEHGIKGKPGHITPELFAQIVERRIMIS